jgi:hypothetical protein
MKTLGKLNINSEKVLKDGELKKLCGGWDGYCYVYCDGAQYGGPASGGSSSSAVDILASTYSWCNLLVITCQ